MIMPDTEKMLQLQKKRSPEDTVILPEVVVTSLGSAIKGKVLAGSISVKSRVDPKSYLEGIAGGVVVGVKVTKEDSLFKKVFNNLFMRKFKTYPNPVMRAASLNIEWSKTNAGNYNMQIISTGGQLVYSRQLWIDAEAKFLSIEVPSVSAGTYFLRMIHKASNNSFTEKIVIQ